MHAEGRELAHIFSPARKSHLEVVSLLAGHSIETLGYGVIREVAETRVTPMTSVPVLVSLCTWPRERVWVRELCPHYDWVVLGNWPRSHRGRVWTRIWARAGLPPSSELVPLHPPPPSTLWQLRRSSHRMGTYSSWLPRACPWLFSLPEGAGGSPGTGWSWRLASGRVASVKSGKGQVCLSLWKSPHNSDCGVNSEF